jgi:hypothetical protein
MLSVKCEHFRVFLGTAKSADMARTWSKQYSTSLPSEALAAALANVKAAKARSPMSGGTNRGYLVSNWAEILTLIGKKCCDC